MEGGGKNGDAYELIRRELAIAEALHALCEAHIGVCHPSQEPCKELPVLNGKNITLIRTDPEHDMHKFPCYWIEIIEPRGEGMLHITIMTTVTADVVSIGQFCINNNYEHDPKEYLDMLEEILQIVKKWHEETLKKSLDTTDTQQSIQDILDQ